MKTRAAAASAKAANRGKKRQARGGTYAYFVRGKNEVADVEDFTVEVDKKKKLAKVRSGAFTGVRRFSSLRILISNAIYISSLATRFARRCRFLSSTRTSRGSSMPPL